MAEEQAQGQVPEPTVPVAAVTPGQEPVTEPTPTQPVAPAPPEPKPGQEPAKVFDAEYVGKLRTSEADTRKKLRDAETELKTLRDATLTEEQRRTAAEQDKTDRLTALERDQERHAGERRQFTLERAVWRLANHEDYLLVDPDAAVKLLDAGAVTFADDGALDQPSLEKALKQLVKDRPYLKRTTTVQSGATTNPSRAQVAPAQETSDQRLDRLYRRGDSIFDSAKAREMGGGVVITERQT